MFGGGGGTGQPDKAGANYGSRMHVPDVGPRMATPPALWQATVGRLQENAPLAIGGVAVNFAGEMNWDDQRLARAICLVLGLVTLAVYLPVAGFDFVNYDDSDYVYANDIIKGGLSLKGIWWAFTHSHSSNWHPLTTITLMLEYQIFGLSARWFHLTNVGLHVANSILLFLVLQRMLKRLWPCAVMAALFAWHPAHVESVAWVSELKDVLSTLFWLLTMRAYLQYVDQPSPRRYRTALILFACGLMCKPMLVTLPCVLLLLDYWPLRRIAAGPVADNSPAGTGWFAETRQWLGILRADEERMRKLVREKIPFFALVLLSSLVTFLVQKQGGAAASLDDFPLFARVLNSLESYVAYIWMLVWPVNLTIFYPLPQPQLPWKGLLAGVALVAATALILRRVRRRPWLFVGWFWYVGTLVPVIGIVQVGNQAHADRYTYVPYVGLFLMIVWSIAEHGWPACHVRRKVATGACAAVLLALLGRTFDQVFYWRNSVTLFEHAIAITENNPLAHADLGVAYYQLGQHEKAFASFKRALDINPNYHHPPLGLGLNLIRTGKYDDAVRILAMVAQHRPKDQDVRQSLGIALAKNGRYEDAMAHFADILKLNPRNIEALTNFGMALAAAGRTDDAITCYLAALREESDLPDTRNNLGAAYESQGKTKEALEQYATAVKLAPDMAEARVNLGKLLAKEGRWNEAAPHFAKTIELKPEDSQGQFYFGLSLLNEQKTGLAITHMREAVRLRDDWVFAVQTLARILATHPDPMVRNGVEAVKLAEKGNQLTRETDPAMLDTLAAAYAEAGKFAEAASTAEKAGDRARAAGQEGLAREIQQRLELYRQQKPFHQGGA
jgi:tetratricopeptide (TPR) repeat protein